MDVVAQGAVWSGLSDPILDAAGAPITGGAGSMTVTLFDAANASQATGISVLHVSAGRYRLTKTLPGNAALGAWGGLLTYNDGTNPVRTQAIDFEVVTAAQADPATALQSNFSTLGSAIATVDDAVDGIATDQAAMQIDVDALLAGVAAANTTLATLDLGPITTTLNDLTAAVANLQTTLDNDPDIAALIAAVGDVEVAVAALNTDIDTMQTTSRPSLRCPTTSMPCLLPSPHCRRSSRKRWPMPWWQRRSPG
jgi:hypothetical protein